MPAQKEAPRPEAPAPERGDMRIPTTPEQLADAVLKPLPKKPKS